MNEQLTFLTSPKPKKLDNKSVKGRGAKSPGKRHSNHRISHHNYQVWWKLSDEEKELGLAGVRSIRNILQKYSLNDQNSIAKAS